MLLGRGVEGLLRIECLRAPHFPFIELRDTSNSYFDCLVVSTDFVRAAIWHLYFPPLSPHALIRVRVP